MFDAVLQRSLELGDQLLHLGLGLRREVAGDIFLAHRFAERGIDQLRAALPARPLFRLTPQFLVAEFEPRVGEPLGQVGRRLVDDVESLPGLQRLERRLGEDRCELREGGVLANDDAARLAHLQRRQATSTRESQARRRRAPPASSGYRSCRGRGFRPGSSSPRRSAFRARRSRRRALRVAASRPCRACARRSRGTWPSCP